MDSIAIFQVNLNSIYRFPNHKLDMNSLDQAHLMLNKSKMSMIKMDSSYVNHPNQHLHPHQQKSPFINLNINESLSAINTPLKRSNQGSKKKSANRYDNSQASCDFLIHDLRTKRNIESQLHPKAYLDMEQMNKSISGEILDQVKMGTTPTFVQEKLAVLENRVNNIERQSINYSQDRVRIFTKNYSIRFSDVLFSRM